MEGGTEVRDDISYFFDWFACNLDTGVMNMEAPAISGFMDRCSLFR